MLTEITAVSKLLFVSDWFSAKPIFTRCSHLLFCLSQLFFAQIVETIDYKRFNRKVTFYVNTRKNISEKKSFKHTVLKELQVIETRKLDHQKEFGKIAMNTI